jgi:hypothetical protein
MGVDADVEVLEDATSDHRPILARIKAMNRSTSMEISRRNFKAIKQVEMQAALQLWPWGDIHGIEDVEEAHKFIMRGIIMALDVVAPYQTIRVRRGDNLYLSSETLDVMEIRDRATGKEYRRLRNKVSSMVKRDRLRTNLDKLRKANNDPKVLWGLANSALGKSKSSLPASLVVDGISTVGNTEAAAAMNGYYIEKVEKLRAGLCPVSPPLVALAQFHIAVPLLLRQCRQDHQGHCSYEKYRGTRVGRHPRLCPQEGSRSLGVAHRPPDQQVACLRHCPRRLQECMRDPHPQGQGEEHRRPRLLPPCFHPPRPL